MGGVAMQPYRLFTQKCQYGIWSFILSQGPFTDRHIRAPKNVHTGETTHLRVGGALIPNSGVSFCGRNSLWHQRIAALLKF